MHRGVDFKPAAKHMATKQRSHSWDEFHRSWPLEHYDLRTEAISINKVIG